jgi:AhpD family alkylhydroperoxidase
VSARHWSYDVHEEFARNFKTFRGFIFEERPGGLSRAMKELLVFALSLSANNPHGAIRHLQEARRAGLTREQFCDALMVVCLVLGVSGVRHGGDEALRLWDATGMQG